MTIQSQQAVKTKNLTLLRFRTKTAGRRARPSWFLPETTGDGIIAGYDGSMSREFSVETRRAMISKFRFSWMQQRDRRTALSNTALSILGINSNEDDSSKYTKKRPFVVNRKVKRKNERLEKKQKRSEHQQSRKTGQSDADIAPANVVLPQVKLFLPPTLR